MHNSEKGQNFKENFYPKVLVKSSSRQYSFLERNDASKYGFLCLSVSRL